MDSSIYALLAAGVTFGLSAGVMLVARLKLAKAHEMERAADIMLDDFDEDFQRVTSERETLKSRLAAALDEIADARVALTDADLECSALSKALEAEGQDSEAWSQRAIKAEDLVTDLFESTYIDVPKDTLLIANEIIGLARQRSEAKALRSTFSGRPAVSIENVEVAEPSTLQLIDRHAA